MAINRTNPLKNDSDEGFEEDFDSNLDAVDARGLYVQNDSSDDTAVVITRDAGNNLTFTDPVLGLTKTLSQLSAGGSGITEGAHQALRQLIHFIDDGPASGFASGAYRETLPASNPFPTSATWYEDNTKAKKIVEKLITYTGPIATTVQWKVYDTDGTTVLATVTDSVSYSGVFETSRTRTIA